MIYAYAFIFFMLGYTLRFFLDIVKIGSYYAKICATLEMEALKLAKEIDERVEYRLKECGERCLVRGDTREILKLFNNEDEEDQKAWREKFMQILSENFPPHVRREFQHETWKEAMNNVEAYYLLLEVAKLQEKDSRKKNGDEN